MSKRLHIGENFNLPLDLVTMTQAILARKRSGKSYTASVQAEELLENKQQIVVVDPTSAWWGLRSSADGTGAGYAIVVMGGDHADAPLDFRSGKAMAAAIVEQGFSAIFDIGGWETDEQIQFVYQFTSEMLRINKEAIHLFIDEADTFAPQMLEGKEQKKCLGAMSRLVKQGGIKGLGVTMITQRSSDINKKLLSQIDILTVMRMSAPDDMVAPIKWIAANVDPAYADEVEKALPRLPIGSGYICSNITGSGHLVEVRKRRTFNSGATPKPGERKQEPKVLAAIDIAKLGKSIADSVEKAKANSPEALQAQVRDLQVKLEAAKRAAPVQTVAAGMTAEEKEAVRMLKEKLDELSAEVGAMEARAGKTKETIVAALLALERATKVLTDELGALDLPQEQRVEAIRSSAKEIAAKLPMRVAPEVLRADVAVRRNVTNVTNAASGDGAKLDGPSQRILATLAEFRAIGIARPDRMFVCLFSGYGNMRSKGFVNALGALRSGGYVDYPDAGTIALTEAGLAVAPQTGMALGNSDLHERIEKMLDGPQTTIFRLVVAAYPRSLQRDDLMAAAGYSNERSKGFVNSIGRLRSLGFIDYPSKGEVVATAQCFLPSGAR